MCLLNNSIAGFDEVNYKAIFVDIAEKLFVNSLISDDEKIKLVTIINKDNAGNAS